MRPIEELINENDSGWPFVAEWINSAKNKVEILTADKQKAKDALYKTQVTTRSPMGSIVFETGGILVHHFYLWQTMQLVHLVFPNTGAKAQKTKRAFF